MIAPGVTHPEVLEGTNTQNRTALRDFLTRKATKSQYLYGRLGRDAVAPEAYELDSALAGNVASVPSSRNTCRTRAGTHLGSDLKNALRCNQDRFEASIALESGVRKDHSSSEACHATHIGTSSNDNFF